MSAMVFQSGCLSGDHMMTWGLRSIGAMTCSVGWSFEFWIASSVATAPTMTDGSRYIWAETCWKPIAGPPERTSRRTPVSRPDATSSADTRFCDASTDGLAPSSRYRPACSACGYQFIWTTIVDGHTGWRSRLPPAAARGAVAGVRAALPPPPHATASATAAAISSRDVAMPIEPSPPAHTFHRSHVDGMLARPGRRGRVLAGEAEGLSVGTAGVGAMAARVRAGVADTPTRLWLLAALLVAEAVLLGLAGAGAVATAQDAVGRSSDQHR